MSTTEQEMSHAGKILCNLCGQLDEVDSLLIYVFYQLGVAQCLLEVAPEVLHRAPKVYGASAGSLAAAAVVCGTSISRVRDEMLKFAKVSREHVLGPLHPSVDVFQWIERVLHRFLPNNAHLLASGRLQVSATRIPDGKNVLISEFQSKDDVVQALLCSCFVPMYCGLMPPSYKGVYYVDGGFTSIQPTHKSQRTLTVSPFAGEVDICPYDHPTRYNIVVSGFTFHLTWSNFFRMMDALFPPACTTLEKAFNSGYQDTLIFLQKSDLIEYGPFRMNGVPSSMTLCSVSEMDSQALLQEEEGTEEKKEERKSPEMTQEEGEGRKSPIMTQEEEGDRKSPEVAQEGGEGHHGLESLTWKLSSLEQVLYLSLPAWVQAALLCNLMAQFGLVNFDNTSLSARLISYLLLPYTLPTCIFFTFSYRLLLWLRHTFDGAFWLWQDIKQIVLFLTDITVSSLRKNLTDRFLASLIFTPKVEHDGLRETALVRRRSTLHIQLSTTGSSHSCSQPEPLAFAFLLDLELCADSHPDTQPLPPCQPPLALGAGLSPEGEQDHLTTLGVEEEDGSHDKSKSGVGSGALVI